jgi:hypothetical protein
VRPRYFTDEANRDLLELYIAKRMTARLFRRLVSITDAVGECAESLAALPALLAARLMCWPM